MAQAIKYAYDYNITIRESDINCRLALAITKRVITVA